MQKHPGELHPLAERALDNFKCLISSQVSSAPNIIRINISLRQNGDGLGSRELVNDQEVFPVRGQAILVDAPWVKHSITAEVGDDVTYIYPRSDGVLLGGTAQFGDWSENIDFADRECIISRCSHYIPIILC